MRSITRPALLILALIAGSASAQQAAPQPASPFTAGPFPAASAPASTAQQRTSIPAPTKEQVERMWSLMKQGGLVLLMRHGKTDQNPPDDPSGITAGNCKTQRNLSLAGREDSARLATQMKERAIPIERVLVSEFCRTADTAEGLVPLSRRGMAAWDKLNFIAGLSAAARAGLSEPAQVTEVRGYLAAYGGAGNLVVVTHTNITNPLLLNFTNQPLQEGEFAVLRPVGSGVFELIGRMPATVW